MTTPDARSAAGILAGEAGPVGSQFVPPPVNPKARPMASKADRQHIRVSPAVLNAARKDGDALLRELGTSLSGLSEAEASERASAAGPNEIAQERKQGWPIRILKIIRNPLVILLTTLSAVSFLTGDARAGSVMALMVALSVGLRFFQEARADAAAEKLKAMIHVTATLVRDGTAKELPLRDLVPGDLVKLAAGDMIPGDVRLLSQKDLFVSQGSLTGESLPVEKFHEPQTEEETSPTELKNTCFMGTIWLPYSPVASALGFTHLPPLYWPILMLTLVAYVALTQVIKVWLLRKGWI
jgi:Mg2+-importing ATPase